MPTFDLDAEFKSQGLIAYASVQMPIIKRKLLAMLEELGIVASETETWHPLSIALTFYQQVREQFGPNTIFDLGKAISQMVTPPPKYDSLEGFLNLLDKMHQQIHQKGYAGHYEIISHDPTKREYIIHVVIPYPYELVKGILIGVGRKYSPRVRVNDVSGKPTAANSPQDYWFALTYL